MVVGTMSVPNKQVQLVNNKKGRGYFFYCLLFICYLFVIFCFLFSVEGGGEAQEDYQHLFRKSLLFSFLRSINHYLPLLVMMVRSSFGTKPKELYMPRRQQLLGREKARRRVVQIRCIFLQHPLLHSHLFIVHFLPVVDMTKRLCCRTSTHKRR